MTGVSDLLLKISATGCNSIGLYISVIYCFQKFLAKNIERSKMASMIYGVNRNGRKGIGYKGKVSQPKKVKDMVIKYTPLYSHFTYGHTHDIKYTSNDFSSKPKFKQNFGNSNKQ